MIIKLTEAFIANSLQCAPGKKRSEVCDDGTGMYIELRSVSPGQGTYYLRYKDSKGKTCHQRIGKTTEISLTDARKQAKTLKAEIELGADPRGEEKTRLAVITMDDFFNDYYLPYVKPRKKSWKRDCELYRRCSAVWGKGRISDVSRRAVQSFHTSLLNEGLAPATANHHLKLIRHMLNLAVEWEMLEKNPACRIPMIFEDNKQERYMNDAQLARFLEVVNSKSRSQVPLIIKWLLSMGCRLGEALGATWDQINREKRVWRIPATNSKSKRSRTVPISDAAMNVLDQLNTEGKFNNLFINPKTGKGYVSIHRVFDACRKEAGLAHLRIHDLRHQYASMVINGGNVGLYTLQNLLGHSDPSVTQRYAHLSQKTLQDATNGASDIITAAMLKSTPPAAVKPAATEAP